MEQNYKEEMSEAEARFTRYISQMLYFNSINYDISHRKHNDRFQVILDENIEGEGNDKTARIDLIASSQQADQD